MKYLVITAKDSMLLTAQELRQIVVSGKVHHYNSRCFTVHEGEMTIHPVKVVKWSDNIPWVDIVDVFGCLLDTLKPAKDCKPEPHSPAYWDQIAKEGQMNACI